MKAPDSAALRHLQRRQRRLWAAIGALCVAALGLAGLDMQGHWSTNHAEAHRDAALFARLTEGHLTRVADSTASTLRVLATHPSVTGTVPAAATAELLSQQLVGLPHLRSLSVVDAGGTVLASSTAGNVGLQINLAQLARQGRLRPDSARETLGTVQMVRDLNGLVPAAAPATHNAAVAVLPMLRPVESAEGVRWLVALLSVDYLATQHALITQGHPVHVITLSLDGVVIDGADRVLTGTDASLLLPFTQFLPEREHGSYEGRGVEGDDDIAAFRTARAWPLVVVAEYPEAPLLADFRREALVIGAIGLAAVALLVGTGFLLQRGLRREARDLRALDRLNAGIAESEERLKLAMLGAGHAPWDANLVDGTCALSAEFMLLLGYPHEAAVWDLAHWLSQLHPDDHARASDLTRQHLRGDLPSLEVEVRVRTARGDWRWCLCAASRTHESDAKGRAVRMVGTLTDIDRRKRAEQALLSSEARQDAILRSALDGIVTVDANGCVLDFNPAAEAMFGLQSADIRGQPMHELIVPHRHRQAHQAGMARYLATGEGPVLNRRVLVEGLRSDGTEFPMELAIVPVRTEAGEVFTATVRDVSERQRIEAELRESRTILDKVGRIAGVGGWTLDLKTQTVRWTDQTALIHDRPAGYQPASLAEAVSYYAPGAEEKVAALVERAILRGEGFDFELQLITATKRSIWVRSLGRAEYEAGQPVRLVGAFQDITARVVAERELQQARSREVQIGARIQQTLLVDAPDQRLPGLWMSTLSQSSQGIDGDFIQLIQLGDQGVDLIVGDVMGKGVAAALMGAATKMQLSRCFTELLARPGRDGAPPEPAEMLAALHRAMTPRLQELDAFVTLSYLRLDVRHGRLTWVGCGHEEALLLTASGALHRLPNQHPPLGVLSDQTFVQDTRPLALEDAVFLCSDGAADARLPDGQIVGRDRLESLLRELLAEVSTPAAVLHALRREIEAMGATLTDDLTLALTVVKDDARIASRRELRNGLADIVHVRELVAHRAAAAGLDEVQAGLFAVACVEAYSNVVRHTRGRPDQAPVEVVVATKPEALVVEIVTLGEAFEPPAELPQTDFAEFPEGGFGLTIMNQASDRVEHLHRHGVNTVRLTRARA